MVKITLPDGSVKQFDQAITGAELAASIGAGLAKAAIAVEVNGKQQDLTTTITTDSTVNIITSKTSAGLEIMRHTVAAQVLAKAVKDLYPHAKLAIGPTIDSGFYYDVDFGDTVLSSDDLPKIEERMREIVASAATIERRNLSRAEALKIFAAKGESYKQEIINDTPEQQGESFGMFFQSGSDFVDLCRGPHLTSLDKIGAFKLLNIAGAYWRGDSKNKMLTRIYGTAFFNEKDLKAHLFMLAEAVKRDHRKIGPALDLFHLQEEAPGQVFWHHKGWQMYLQLQQYIRSKLRAADYQEVNTPQRVNVDIFKKSGHWDNYKENMFFVKVDEQQFSMKPMNCPCHVQIFNQGIKSYRDLPIRMSEFGTCMRNEATGALHGLMRVTTMVQDDAHIFCTFDQIEEEVVQLCALIKEIYSELGFGEPFVKFSDRPEKRVGSDAVWDKAENALKDACKKANLPWVLNAGDGAFYGPKLEFVLKDCLGRDWQCGTVQLDFNLPERLNATYVGEDGQRHTAVMIHRALLGSLERFMGILIENYAGNFPLWIAPTQIVLTGITDKQNAAVEALRERLKGEGFRVEADLRNEKVNYKIREHSIGKIPVIGVMGDKEIEQGTITIRRLGSDKQTTLSVEALIAQLKEEVRTLAQPPFKAAMDEEAA
jgi:threonyl-tRNA synthetase